VPRDDEEIDKGWGSSDEEALSIPHGTSRHGQIVCKNLTAIINPISIEVFQKSNPELRIAFHFLRRDVLAGGFT